MSQSFEVNDIRLYRPNRIKTKEEQYRHDILIRELKEDIKEFYTINEILNKIIDT